MLGHITCAAEAYETRAALWPYPRSLAVIKQHMAAASNSVGVSRLFSVNVCPMHSSPSRCS